MLNQSDLIPTGAPIREARLLPAQPPAQVIGRNREVTVMYRALRAGFSVLLAGPAGSGKTALSAVMAAAQLAERRSIVWLNTQEDDYRTLVARIGRAFGLETYADPVQGAISVRNALQKEKPLLVLDGLLDPDAVRELLKHCATGIPTILTSEESIPGPWTPLSLGPLAEQDARALLRHYAGIQDDSQDVDIASVCKFLDGYPLTLQLAGRHMALDNVTPAEMLAKFPTSAGRNVQPSIMSIAFKQLNPAVQGMMLVLATTFSGSVSAELLAELSGATQAQATAAMRQLIGRGFAREMIAYGQSVYVLHEAAQRFATDWLRSYQRLTGLESRALSTIVAYAEKHATRDAGDQDRLAVEMPSIVGAAAYATDRGDRESLVRLLDAVQDTAGDFVARRGFYPELDQMRRLTTLLVPASPMPAPEIPGSLPEAVGHETEPTRPATEPIKPIKPLIPTVSKPPSAPELGPLAATVAREPIPPADATVPAQSTPALPPPAIPKVADTRPVGEQPTEPVPIPAPLPIAGRVETPTRPMVRIDLGDLDDVPDLPGTTLEPPEPNGVPEPDFTPGDPDALVAQTLLNLETQLREARDANDKVRLGPILRSAGEFHASRGDYPSALDHYRQALDIFEEREDTEGQASTLEALTRLARLTETPNDDLEYAQRGIEIVKKTGDKARLGRLTMALGDAYLSMGEIDKATEALTQAVQLLRATEDWPTIGLALGKLGDAFMEGDKYQEAIMIYEQASVIFHRQGQVGYEARSLDRIAAAYANLRQWDKALEGYERALYLARERFDRASEAVYLESIGAIHKAQGHREAAITRYRQALHVAYMLGDTALQAEYMRQLGELLLYDDSALEQAAQLLEEANTLNPDSKDIQRMYGRLQKRLDRLAKAGVELSQSEETPRHYAAQAYVG